jgi:hypothetical protein
LSTGKAGGESSSLGVSGGACGFVSRNNTIGS